MSTHLFTVQDASGRRCRIEARLEGEQARGQEEGRHAPVYLLEDGSHVRRIDNDTFQVVATGAYVTRVAD